MFCLNHDERPDKFENDETRQPHAALVEGESADDWLPQ